MKNLIQLFKSLFSNKPQEEEGEAELARQQAESARKAQEEKEKAELARRQAESARKAQEEKEKAELARRQAESARKAQEEKEKAELARQQAESARKAQEEKEKAVTSKQIESANEQVKINILDFDPNFKSKNYQMIMEGWKVKSIEIDVEIEGLTDTIISKIKDGYFTHPKKYWDNPNTEITSVKYIWDAPKKPKSNK